MTTSPRSLDLSENPQNDAFDAQLPCQPISKMKISGRVVHGFKRGSRLLGCPTANIDPGCFTDAVHQAPRGVYIGYLRFVSLPTSISEAHTDEELKEFSPSVVYRTVLSIGTNPTFETTSDTVECYILHSFPCDFYDATVSLMIVGYLRPQEKFDSLDELVRWIERDVRVGGKALLSENYRTIVDSWRNNAH